MKNLTNTKYLPLLLIYNVKFRSSFSRLYLSSLQSTVTGFLKFWLSRLAKKLTFFVLWSWTLTCNLDLWSWLRWGKVEPLPPCHICTLKIILFKYYYLDTPLRMQLTSCFTCPLNWSINIVIFSLVIAKPSDHNKKGHVKWSWFAYCRELYLS